MQIETRRKFYADDFRNAVDDISISVRASRATGCHTDLM